MTTDDIPSDRTTADLSNQSDSDSLYDDLPELVCYPSSHPLGDIHTDPIIDTIDTGLGYERSRHYCLGIYNCFCGTCNGKIHRCENIIWAEEQYCKKTYCSSVQYFYTTF